MTSSGTRSTHQQDDAADADPELDQRATFYSYFPPGRQGQAAIEQFNARKSRKNALGRPHERRGGHRRPNTVKDSGGNEPSAEERVRATAIDGGSRVVIDTIDRDVQSAFEAIAEKLGLDLTCPCAEAGRHARKLPA
jgi:hypothetical protein